ncbi:MAG TPA: hypothetical protein VN783_15980 [Thermoanaerobaculia bacterium]|nr:hypothetical protein [Thermoanaerobaculia bacterium]
MANLTIAIEDEVLRRARLRAVAQGTSVNALLRDYLQGFAGARIAQESAIRSLLERSARARSNSGGRKVSRDELHER